MEDLIIPTYEFACDKCKVITEKRMSIHSTTEDKAQVKCQVCGGDTYQTFTESGGFIFKEGHFEESAKPGSYWRNAEKVKQNNIKKNQDIQKEKLASGDQEAVAKEIRRAQNAANNPDNEVD